MSEMREPTFLILSALADGPKHGYAIIADAAEQSEGRVRLQAGTLYAALDRLASEGLVETTGEEVVGGRRRRYVGLTHDGRAELQREAEHRAANARRVLARLGRTTKPAVAR
jgi:DNA-binding PadR family transcriptional regulator